MADVETYFDYEDQHGFRGAVEMCNGAGVCRKKTGGTMCPSYMATLDERSGGRMLCGLGSSGAYVVEHWHGVPFVKPLRRIREYTEIINMIMRREPLIYHGEAFNLERGFKLRGRLPGDGLAQIVQSFLQPPNMNPQRLDLRAGNDRQPVRVLKGQRKQAQKARDAEGRMGQP